MIKLIFRVVANALYAISRITGLSYNEINILLYYFLIPFTWLLMLDIIFDIHYFKFSFVVFCIGFYIGCRDFKSYSDWLFHKSVVFLNYFNRYGSNYHSSSVWICVAVPILIYMILAYAMVLHK